MSKSELVDLSNEVWTRTRARLDGLSDDEYFWEPAPGCWTIRRRADGTWFADWPMPRPDPEPFTTIAWRTWHLIDMYGENRAPRWLAVPAQGDAIGVDAPDPQPPATAAVAIAMLDRAHDRWDAHLDLVTDAALAEPIGAVAGPHYEAASRAAYVLHMLDEFVHHGAEISLLRDLWRWQHPISTNRTRELIARGDVHALDDVDDSELTATLVDHAAAYGRWHLVMALVERGAPLSAAGATPLHMAAGAGQVDLVKLLLERGADPTVRDPQFHATPRQWADFLHQPAVVTLLDNA